MKAERREAASGSRRYTTRPSTGGSTRGKKATTEADPEFGPELGDDMPPPPCRCAEGTGRFFISSESRSGLGVSLVLADSLFPIVVWKAAFARGPKSRTAEAITIPSAATV